MSTASPRRRYDFSLKLAVAAALVLAGDLLFYQRGRFGAFIGVFALAWLAATVFANPALRRRRSALACALLAMLVAGALVFDPGLLAWTLFWIALSMAALLPATGRFDDGWRWFQRLSIHAVRSVAGPISDALKLRRVRGKQRWTATAAAALPTLVLPVMGSVVILLLFALANPVIGDLLGAVSLPAPSTSMIGRAIFWAMLLALVWGTLRPRRTTRLFATFDGSGDLDLPGVTPASVTLSLILFNALFAFQNLLDIAYLWGGLPLPEGMTLAQYAHRGAYPLIATALLAALFVLVTLRPGSRMAASPMIRRLLVLWIAQNVFLVGSTILRTLDYVDAYSLTRLRIAALGWMVLVAVGLLLICWRLLRGKTSSWLINANLAAAGSMLIAFCFVDTGAVAAAWNVRHAREVGGRGAALDLCYLRGLGGAALIPLTELEQRTTEAGFADRVRAVRQQVMDEVMYLQDEGGWTPRNAYRLSWAIQRLGDEAKARVTGQRDCAGRIVPHPPTPEVERQPPAAAPAPVPPPPAPPLTGEPQR